MSLVFISCAKDNLKLSRKKRTDDGTLEWSVKIIWIIATSLIFTVTQMDNYQMVPTEICVIILNHYEQVVGEYLSLL